MPLPIGYMDHAFSALKVLEEHYGVGMVETGEDHSSVEVTWLDRFAD